jgi:DNA-binding transcriptional ArsR family regulator
MVCCEAKECGEWLTGSNKVVEDFHENAKRASSFLKSLANKNRLIILCALVEGEKNVSQLEKILGVRQPTLSQQLARLRADKMVETRRDSKQIFYKLCNDEAELVLDLIFELFCTGGSQDMDPKPRPKSD